MARKILILLLTLTVLLALLASFAWYLLGNEPFLKRQLHAAVLRSTGRSLEIQGPLRLSLGSVTTIEAQDIHFSNPGWTAEPDMAKVGHFQISLDLWSLFDGHMIIHELEIADCQVALVKNEQGEKNWNLFPQAAEKETPLDAGEQEAWKFQLDSLKINNCDFTHDAPNRNHTLSAGISDLALQLRETGGYKGQASGQVESVPLTLSGEFGPVKSLWLGGPFEHAVDLQLGQITLKSSGMVADALTGSGANITMQFSGPEFAQVTDYLAWPPFSSDAFDFSLQFETKGEMTALNVDGDLGSFKITASGELDRVLRPYVGDMNITATGPDLDALGQLFGIQGLVKEPFDFSLLATVDKGRINLTPATLSTSQGKIEVKGMLGLLPDLGDSAVDVTVQTDDIGRWAALWGRPPRVAGALSANGHLATDAAGVLSGEAEFQHLSSHLKVSGSLGKLTKPNQPNLDFEFQSSNLSSLRDLLEYDKLPVAPARAKGHYSLDEQGSHFKAVTVGLADNHAQIDGTLTRAVQFAGSEFSVQADISNTASLGLLFGYPDLPVQPLKVTAIVKPVGAGLEFQVSDGNLGDIKLSLKGRMDDVAIPSSFTADVAIDLPSARLLEFLLPDTELPDLPLAINGGIRHQTGSAHLQQVRINLGHSVVNLDGDVVFGETYEGTNLKFSGSGADLTELVHWQKLETLPKDFSFSGQLSKGSQSDSLEDVEIHLGKMKAVLNGTVESLSLQGELALQVRLDVPDVSVLNALLDQSWDARSMSAESLVKGTLEDFTLTNLAAKHGISQITGNLQIKPGKNTRLSGSLHADYLDLKTWLLEQEAQSKPGDTTPAKKTSGSKSMVFDDTPVMNIGKHPFDVDIDLRVDRANLANAVVEDVRLGILLLDDQLRLDPLQGHDQNGSSINGKFALDATGALPQLDITLSGENLRLGLVAVEGQDPATYPPIQVEIDLHGQGATRHEMASSLNGKVQVFQGPGQVAITGLESIFSDFVTNLFTTLNPNAKQSKYTQLVCAVIAAEVESGLAKFDPVIFLTSEITIVSSGTIDLVTERVDLAFNSAARKGIGLSAGTLINPFIKVGGTLAAPAMQLDPGQAVLSGGAAVATVGISLLAKSFADRFLSSNDPCGDARKKLAEKK